MDLSAKRWRAPWRALPLFVLRGCFLVMISLKKGDVGLLGSRVLYVSPCLL